MISNVYLKNAYFVIGKWKKLRDKKGYEEAVVNCLLNAFGPLRYSENVCIKVLHWNDYCRRKFFLELLGRELNLAQVSMDLGSHYVCQGVKDS